MKCSSSPHQPRTQLRLPTCFGDTPPGGQGVGCAPGAGEPCRPHGHRWRGSLQLSSPMHLLRASITVRCMCVEVASGGGPDQRRARGVGYPSGGQLHWGGQLLEEGSPSARQPRWPTDAITDGPRGRHAATRRPRARAALEERGTVWDRRGHASSCLARPSRAASSAHVSEPGARGPRAHAECTSVRDQLWL